MGVVVLDISRKHAPLLLIALTGLMLAGCGGEEQHATSGNAGASSSDAEGTVEVAPESDSDGANSAAAAVSGKECLPGDWRMDNEKFAELMSSVAGFEVSDLEGSAALFIQEDGATTTEYQNWAYTFSQDGVSMKVVRNGTDESVYTATDDGRLTVQEVSMRSVTTLETEGGSFAYDPADDALVFTEATFVCEGDELTITAEGAAMVFGRHR